MHSSYDPVTCGCELKERLKVFIIPHLLNKDEFWSLPKGVTQELLIEQGPSLRR